MSEKKLIAVMGATGAQGGGLAHAILSHADGPFALRAITRNPGSEKAQALKAGGAEVVQADLDDVDSLKAAFQGVHGVFGLTNYWEHFDVEKETQQARNIADAAKAAGVQHVVWSTFRDSRDLVPLSDDRMPTLNGKYKIPHFESKAQANSHFEQIGVPTTFLLTSFYWDNLIHFGMGPKPGEDGKLGFAFPMDDKLLPGIAAEDIGKCAYGIFAAGDEFVGKFVGIAGEHLTGNDMAQALTTAIGQEVVYHAVPPEVYRGFGFPGADDLGNMFQYKRDFQEQFVGDRDVATSKRLNPELQTFAQWLSTHAQAIPIQ